MLRDKLFNLQDLKTKEIDNNKKLNMNQQTAFSKLLEQKNQI